MTGPTFSHELTADPATLVLHGELDEGASVVVRELISHASGGLSHDLRIELSDVQFIPSAAVGVLAKSRDTARRNGATLTFVAEEGCVAQRVLAICDLPYEAP